MLEAGIFKCIEVVENGLRVLFVQALAPCLLVFGEVGRQYLVSHAFGDAFDALTVPDEDADSVEVGLEGGDFHVFAAVVGEVSDRSRCDLVHVADAVLVAPLHEPLETVSVLPQRVTAVFALAVIQESLLGFCR